jgi:hypothetical protein
MKSATLALVAVVLLLGGVRQARAGPLVVRYVFDGNALDVSGNANNGTIVGNPSFIPGESGQAILFQQFVRSIICHSIRSAPEQS